jgi:hypothetical protein
MNLCKNVDTFFFLHLPFCKKFWPGITAGLSTELQFHNKVIEPSNQKDSATTVLHASQTFFYFESNI